MALCTAVAGLGLSIYARTRIAQAEAATSRLTAETLRQNTRQELELFADVLESVRALHTLSDAVDQAAMDEFIKKGLVYQHAILGPFGLAQRISPQVRSVLEKEAAEQGTGYRVVKEGPDGSWVPAESKSSYYPLTWQSRTKALCIPVGFDFSSLDEALQTIRRIERTRRTAMVPAPIPPSLNRSQQTDDGLSESTTPTHPPSPRASDLPPPTAHLLQSPSPSYWVFSPVMPRYAPNSVIGFAVAALNPDTILKRVAARSSLSPELQLKWITPQELNSGETIQLVNRKWLYRSPLKAVDALWMFECSLPVTVTGHHSTAALLFGLIITALITSQLFLLGNRTRKIEAEVNTRTEELHLANKALEKNLHERAHMEEEMNELAARERRRIGRDLHDSLGQKLAGAVFLSRSLMDYFEDSRSQESGVRDQESKNKDRGQRTEDGSQKSEVRDQTSENNPSNPATSHIPHSTSHVPPSTSNNSQLPEPQIPSSGGVPERRGGFKKQATVLNETLKAAVAQVRNMARGLAPVALNDERLSEALQQLAEEMTSLYGVSCEFLDSTADRSACPATTSLSRRTKEQLYLIAREAVNNAARHAQAERITIQMTGDKSGWTLRIEDDGKGLPFQVSAIRSQPSSFSSGMGIRIMRHRANLIGAEFTITSTPDEGTCISVQSQRS